MGQKIMTLICRAILHQEGALIFMIKKFMRKSVVTRIQKSINSCLLQLGLSEEGCDNQLL